MNQVIWDRLARELKKALPVASQYQEAWNKIAESHLRVGYIYGLSTQELEG